MTLNIPCINRMALPYVRVNFRSEIYFHPSRRAEVLIVFTVVSSSPCQEAEKQSSFAQGDSHIRRFAGTGGAIGFCHRRL